MAAILNWIMESIRSYGAWSVFIGVIIESVIVPIPSPLIIMGAGFVLISPQLSFFEALVPILLQIVLPGSVASTLGAYIGYGIGYFGGKTVVDRWKGFLGFNWSDVESLERRFQGGRVEHHHFLFAGAADLSALGHFRSGRIAPFAAQAIQPLDVLRSYPALSFTGLSWLGSRRDVPGFCQRP